MQSERKQPNRNIVNLALDSAMLVAFLVVMAPRFSGMAVHEWLGIAFSAAITTHLLLHWQWLVGVTKRFFKQTQWSARINYLLNTILFIDLTIVIFTGLMISEVALPTFGIQLSAGRSWRGIHETAANLSLALIGLHVALHWQWIANMVKRFVIAPLTAGRQLPQLAHETTSVPTSAQAMKQQQEV